MLTVSQLKPPLPFVKHEPPVEEDLGTAKMQGFDVRGHRTTFKTPIGEIGNSAPLVHTWDRWVAINPGLTGLLVREVRSDLQYGKSTNELVKFDQIEPEPSVFQPPAGYEIVTVSEEMQEAPHPQPKPPAQ
jgi:hypothetical protein